MIEIIILGDKYTGKTNFIYGKYNNYITTIGMDIVKRIINNIEFVLYDLNGYYFSKFSNYTNYILVFSLENIDTFYYILEKLDKLVGKKVVIVATFLDKKKISTKFILEKILNIPYIELSIKTGEIGFKQNLDNSPFLHFF
jgi:hypothetical protein